MQAIGTAGSSAAGRHVATPATASGMLLAGGATPATGGASAPAPGAPPAVTPAALTGILDEPIAVDLVFPDIAELAGAKALAGRSAVPIRVSEKTPSVGDVMATLDEPVVNRSDALVAKRDKLRAALVAGTAGDPKQVVKILDDLDFVIKLVQRSEEKKRLLKEILKKLLMGVLTPQIISQAKSLGLTGFLKDAIRAMLKGGNISPQQAKALSTMLSTAGIQMPELDEFVLRHEKSQQQITDAAKAARGLQPVQPDRGGTASTGTAITGVRTLGVPPVSSLS